MTNREIRAADTLQEAVDLDSKKRFTEALLLYQKGLRLLMDEMHGTKDVNKKKHFESKVQDYMTRAEKVKSFIEQQKSLGYYHEETVIKNNSKGHGFLSLFGRFLNHHITKVEIEDPYIRNEQQLGIFTNLCCLLVEECKNLKDINLVTVADKSNDLQITCLEKLKSDLSTYYSINLIYSFSNTLHDRQIMFNNGWFVKIGRGLDYFKNPKHKYSLGIFDLDFRACRETSVDIFYKKE